jgi:hypothetical protein
MAKTPIPSLASVPVTAPSEGTPTAMAMPASALPTQRRESLHVRIPVDTVDRVREAAHRLRRDKQDIADEALREWLDRQRF